MGSGYKRKRNILTILSIMYLLLAAANRSQAAQRAGVETESQLCRRKEQLLQNRLHETALIQFLHQPAVGKLFRFRSLGLGILFLQLLDQARYAGH